MGYNGVPPRWEEYSNIGKLIPGTPIIPFKVPLRKEICRNLSNSNLSFTLEDLLNHCKDINLSMVIDLTQTKRFYNGENLQQHNIEYVKLSTRGGGCMPNDFEVKQFCDIIDNHLKEYPESVVGVHCTHGLNRTGYFICRYMIDRLGFLGSDSVNLFEECRGHRIDRENYRDFLMKKIPRKNFPDSSNNNDFKDCKKFQNSKEHFNDQYSCDNNKATSSIKYETNHQTHKYNKFDKSDSDKQKLFPRNSDKYSNDKTSYDDYRSYKARNLKRRFDKFDD